MVVRCVNLLSVNPLCIRSVVILEIAIHMISIGFGTHDQVCDFCNTGCFEPDPLDADVPVRWGYPRKSPDHEPDGGQCYFCRRLHRADAALANILV